MSNFNDDVPLVEILPPDRKRDSRKLAADAFAVARRGGLSPEAAALEAGGTLADLRGTNRMKSLIAEKTRYFDASDEDLLKFAKLALSEMAVDGKTEEQKFAAIVALTKVLDNQAKRGAGAPAASFSAGTLDVLERVDET